MREFLLLLGAGFGEGVEVARLLALELLPLLPDSLTLLLHGSLAQLRLEPRLLKAVRLAELPRGRLVLLDLLGKHPVQPLRALAVLLLVLERDGQLLVLGLLALERVAQLSLERLHPVGLVAPLLQEGAPLFRERCGRFADAWHPGERPCHEVEVAQHALRGAKVAGRGVANSLSAEALDVCVGLLAGLEEQTRDDGVFDKLEARHVEQCRGGGGVFSILEGTHGAPHVLGHEAAQRPLILEREHRAELVPHPDHGGQVHDALHHVGASGKALVAGVERVENHAAAPKRGHHSALRVGQVLDVRHAL
mmetsp:Transcript_7735/g.25671  ORF Transcript_7735/g.25671 Transcript_7735/m.25671 type:complete len:307 (-) Transcript_7735:1433-2353(-)